MALGLILLLSLLALVKSSPNMFVTVTGEVCYGDKSPKVEVNLAGMDQAIVTDRERFKFQLRDDRLKNCVSNYYGRRPDDAYVRSPTPWGDLYSSYGWRQIHRIIKPLKATILSVVTKQEAISMKVYKNSQSTPGTAKVAISRAYANTLTTEWSHGEEFTVDREVSISASLKVIDIGASTSISKAKSWGQRDEHSETTTIVDSAELEVTIPPYSSVYVKSELYKTTVNVRVEYEASLVGDTAVNYKDVYRGHHFFGLDINSVMESCGLKTEQIITEDIKLDLITGGNIEAVDGPASKVNLRSIGKLHLEVIEV